MKVLQGGELIGWFLQRASELELRPGHFSLFLALYALSSGQLGVPFRVSRKKLMAISRVRSVVTYHRWMKELVELGLIVYEPSYHPLLGSKVVFVG